MKLRPLFIKLFLIAALFPALLAYEVLYRSSLQAINPTTKVMNI